MGPAPRKHHSPDSSSSDAADATAIIRAKKKKSRYAVESDDGGGGGGGGDRVECSGKYCRSCSAGMIADCVALCCCPCAVVNLLTLVFVKVPWMVGRRCLGFGKSKKKKKKMMIKNQGQNRKSKKKCKQISSSYRNQRCAEEEELPAQISCHAYGYDREEVEEEEDCVSSAERVWLELYQVGYLGFGRVSFGGAQSMHLQQGKGNLGT